jgi:hypothetical protein
MHDLDLSCRHAGIDELYAKAPIVTTLSTLFRQGIRINVVSKLLGHKDVATTYKIY